MSENKKIRLTECPKCRNEEFVEDASYCHICGHKIVMSANEFEIEKMFENLFKPAKKDEEDTEE